MAKTRERERERELTRMKTMEGVTIGKRYIDRAEVSLAVSSFYHLIF